jgi:cytidine deaminase
VTEGGDAAASKALVERASEARAHAIATYSGFAVGAAMRDQSGRVWTGANVENASFGLGLCAERVAIFHALTHGAGRDEFEEIAIVTAADAPTPPCGACRQILAEFAPSATLVLVGRAGFHAAQRRTVRELMPDPFDGSSL